MVNLLVVDAFDFVLREIKVVGQEDFLKDDCFKR